MNEYQKQAEDFLKATGATIAFQYVGHTSRMDGAKVPTAQFRVTITREGRKPWAFDYNDSIAESYLWSDGHLVPRWGAMPQSLHGKVERETRRTPDDAMREAALSANPVRWASYYVKRHTPKPTAYDVLACIEKHCPDTFEEFCGDYGYDTDSRKALDTYLAVQKEVAEVRRLFTPEEIERLGEIQ